jgi:metal-dependent HD superfamily phosphatase/phosphodiesterase
MTISKNFELSYKYAELVILLASLLHDLGMSVNREGHEEFSLFLTDRVLESIIDFLPEEEKVIVKSEALHAIISHRSGGTPYTIEAGIVRVSDALDLSEGRSRIPYEAGNVDIHSVSAAAIDKVEIKEGKEKPVQINIYMNNSAGLFQVDELLKKKLKGSGIEKYVVVKAFVIRETSERI